MVSRLGVRQFDLEGLPLIRRWRAVLVYFAVMVSNHQLACMNDFLQKFIKQPHIFADPLSPIQMTECFAAASLSI